MNDHFDWEEDPNAVLEFGDELPPPAKGIVVEQKKPFSKTSLVLWGVVIVSGLVLEALGLYSEEDAWPPLTQIIVAYVPWFVTGGFIAWLKKHFEESYND